MSGSLMGDVYYYQFTAAQQSVLLAMADHANEEGENVYPGVETIAWKLGHDRRNVQRAIRQLENMGVLVPIAYRNGGRNHPTLYRIALEHAPLREAPPPGGGRMYRKWLAFLTEKGGASATVYEQEETKGGASATVYEQEETKGGASATVSPKGRRFTHEKGGVSRTKGGVSRTKGGASAARISIESPYESPEGNTRARGATDAHTSLSKNEKAEAEADPDTPEAEPPPDCAAPPPFSEFARAYRKHHGIGSRYSDMHHAYFEEFGVMPA